MRKRENAVTALVLAGLAAIAVGVGLLSVAWGVIVLGTELVTLGVLLAVGSEEGGERDG
mgnify:FL=1